MKYKELAISDKTVASGIIVLSVIIVISIFYIGNLRDAASTTDAAMQTFYINSATANVRECASLSCRVVTTYHFGDSFQLPYKNANDLPEWIQISWPDYSGKVGIAGYVNKITLTDKQIVAENPMAKADTTVCNGNNYTACPAGQDFVCPANGGEAYCQLSQKKTQPQNIYSNPSGDLSPSLIEQIEPMVVEVNCYPLGSSNFRIMGSGTSILNNGIIYIVTNAHVFLEAYSGSQAPTCFAVYPEPPNFTYNEGYGDYNLSLLGYKFNPNIYQDVAVFTLGSPLPSSIALNHIPTTSDLPQLGNSGCPEAKVGDGLTIFGYPNSGNSLGISETVTYGKISGIVAGPIYKTNAAMDHGNSGGLAILNKNSCILGIPTLGTSGLTAGIGYIQSLNLTVAD